MYWSEKVFHSATTVVKITCSGECLASRYSRKLLVIVNFFLSFQLNAHNVLNTYIYHLLPPTCFGVSYTIFRQTIALFAPELCAFFCNVVALVVLQNIKCTLLFLISNEKITKSLQHCKLKKNGVYFILSSTTYVNNTGKNVQFLRK